MHDVNDDSAVNADELVEDLSAPAEMQEGVEGGYASTGSPTYYGGGTYSVNPGSFSAMYPTA
jgi:hypothetical protein